uniref:Uncharacterized protein n=1 Tax=Octopus bimaculoides TaxID=37653 RepID=A0A0L8G231_OCTBM
MCFKVVAKILKAERHHAVNLCVKNNKIVKYYGSNLKDSHEICSSVGPVNEL